MAALRWRSTNAVAEAAMEGCAWCRGPSTLVIGCTGGYDGLAGWLPLMPMAKGCSSEEESRNESYLRLDGEGRERLEHDELSPAGDAGPGTGGGTRARELGVAGLAYCAGAALSWVLGT